MKAEGFPAWFERYGVLFLLLLCAVNFVVGLGGHSLWDVDEPNNAVCAREMLLAGNWWVPMFNGDLRYDKPILIYWLLMPLYSLFGINEWTARLPSAMAITLLVWVVFEMTRRLTDRSTGLLAGLLLASSLHIILIARACVPDPLLMLSLGFALPAFLLHDQRWRQQQGPTMPGLLIMAYIALGLGVLAKGPVAVVMPAMVLGAFLLLAGRWQDWRRFYVWRGTLIVMLIALPWYITVGVLTDGDWLRGFLLHHNIDRFTGALQGHHGFPGYYVLTYLLGWFPWSGLMGMALLAGAWRLKALRDQPVRLFLLVWIGVYIVFFSIARTQLPNYLLPAFVPGAMLMALWWRGASDGQRQRARQIVVVTALVLALAIVLGGGIAIDRMWPGEWTYLLGIGAVVLAVLLLLWRQRFHLWLSLSAAMAVFVLSLTLWSLPHIDAHKVAPELAEAATVAGFDDDALATYNYFQPSLLFYHGGRLPVLADQAAIADWLLAGKAMVLPQQELVALPQKIMAYLIIHKRVYGLYARKWLVLVSLQPVEGIAWPINH